MNEKTLKILEFNKIKNLLLEYVSTEGGINKVKNLHPNGDRYLLEKSLEDVDNALALILSIGKAPISGFESIDEILKRLDLGGALSIYEILKVKNILSISSRVFDYYKSNRDEIEALNISELFAGISPHKMLLSDINRIILDENTISDNASSELKKIRRQMEKVNHQIREKLSSYIASSKYKNVFMDNVVTMKNGRYCVPVKAEHKNTFKGIVQSSSATGSTVFIEPMAVVELGNELSRLENDERIEIDRILAVLSSQIAGKSEEIVYNTKFLSELDFIFAKADFALKIDGHRPKFSDDKSFNLVKARHPLLDPKNVVAIDINLGKTFKTLIITGPNTGGKTVALKTVGLISVMASSGLFIPCHESSEIALFDEIYADIGDEQSIEQSLSTFSAHMVNIVDILKKANDNDLILFDELGAGTDPIEGAALATAILENIKSKGILSIATTHYSELKMYALSTGGVENASCEFDINSLIPTYKLLIGVPGKSNAFAISKRLGLNDDILGEAKKHLENDDIVFEDVLIELERNKRLAKKEREKSKRLLNETIKERKKFRKEQKRFESRKEKMIEDAKLEAMRIVEEAKSDADSIISNLRKSSNNLDFKELEKGRDKLRNKMKNLSKNENNSDSDSKSIDVNSLKVGESVFVKTMGRSGILTSISKDKKEATVKLGILNTSVKISDLRLSEEESKKEKEVSKGSYRMSKASSIKTEIDLRGMLTLDAKEKLDKYLDDAYLSNLKQCTIIHGKGSGAMKDAVHKHLRKLSYIKSYRLGNYGEGDSGVTIVEFK